jgi:hypothetical protein
VPLPFLYVLPECFHTHPHEYRPQPTKGQISSRMVVMGELIIPDEGSLKNGFHLRVTIPIDCRSDLSVDSKTNCNYLR